MWLQEATQGKGVDVIVEMLANVNLSKDLQMLSYGGRVAVSQRSHAAGDVKIQSVQSLKLKMIFSTDLTEPTWSFSSSLMTVAMIAVSYNLWIDFFFPSVA